MKEQYRKNIQVSQKDSRISLQNSISVCFLFLLIQDHLYYKGHWNNPKPNNISDRHMIEWKYKYEYKSTRYYSEYIECGTSFFFVIIMESCNYQKKIKKKIYFNPPRHNLVYNVAVNLRAEQKEKGQLTK